MNGDDRFTLLRGRDRFPCKIHIEFDTIVIFFFDMFGKRDVSCDEGVNATTICKEAVNDIIPIVANIVNEEAISKTAIAPHRCLSDVESIGETTGAVYTLR